MDMMKSLMVLGAVLTAVACGDDTGTSPDPGDGANAVVIGRVETTSAPMAPAAGPTAQPAAGQAVAQTVAVAAVRADGSLEQLAQAEVQADGTFRVEGVPAGRTDLQVVAYGDAQAELGRVLVQSRTEAGATITTAPINLETTVESRTYARLKAGGSASASSAAEVSLLTRTDAAAASAILAEGKVDAMAQGVAAAGTAMTAVFAQGGAALDARARAEAIAGAAVQFARSRHGGASLEAAHDAFLEASLAAYAQAGAKAEALVMATAAAATSLDARLDAGASFRGAVTAEAVRMNLRARERLAAGVASTVGTARAAAVMDVLASARADVRGAATADEIRTILRSSARTAGSAATDAAVEILVPGGDLALRAVVKAAAGAVVDVANLSARLEGAANASAVAQAMADYRSAVRAAVDAMVEVSGRADVDADALTSLFIAANGCAHVR